MNYFDCIEVICFANDNDSLVPELWAREALAVLSSNLVMGNLVNRDYSDMVANFGDVVNTSRPADFSGKRKTDADSVTEQDAVSPNIPVPLNQHFHVTFVIKDGEMSKALPNLVERYLEPAARELAEKVDQVICGQVARLTANIEGRSQEMTKTTAADFVLEANTKLDINRVPKIGRNLVLGPRAHQATLGADLFVEADKRGDMGSALREASLGRVYGMDAFMDQNMSYVALADADVAVGATDGAEALGATVVETTAAAAARLEAGCYVWFEGEGYLHRISSVANPTTAADITLVEGLKAPVGAAADVQVYLAGDVNNVAGYASGWTKEVVVDGHTANKGPQLGQLVTFGTGVNSHSYTVIAVTENSTTESAILLDRPLESSIADGDAVFYGPAGGMNLAFHRDAIALVNRPLSLVPADSGARSFVASYDGLSMRVTMQYDSSVQGMRVTFDLLCGVAILDDRQAVLLLS